MKAGVLRWARVMAAVFAAELLVLLDVMIPGLDGVEVCRRLRAAAPIAEVPVVMVTALDDQAGRSAGQWALADCQLLRSRARRRGVPSWCREKPVPCHEDNSCSG